MHVSCILNEFPLELKPIWRSFMKKNVTILALSSLCLLFISSCKNDSPSSSSSNDAFSSTINSEEEKPSSEIKPSSSQENSEWDTNYSDKNYVAKYKANPNFTLADIDYNTPSSGTQPVLVIPVTFTNKTFTDAELEDIKTLTGGTREDTKYWESLKSYYEKSSYGKLNLEFTYSDPVSMGMDSRTFKNKYGKIQNDVDSGKAAAVALKEGVKAYKKKNGDSSTKKFDTDGDGYIDSVIMIYAENDTPSFDSNGDVFWAYRYWDLYDESNQLLGYAPDGNVSSPIGNSYFWASLSFFYEGTGTRNSHTGVDSHTLVHEFGHMLGADDYYNSDSDASSEVTGGKIMMAYNISDHDAFNKLQYNWVEPTYAFGSCEVTIRPLESSGDCILLADKNGWNGTAFDEYVLIEYYTPTGLNELDAKTPYGSNHIQGESEAGVRIWHVDNRLAKVSSKTGVASAYYSDEEIKNGSFNDNNYYPLVACGNGEEKDLAVSQGKGFDSLTLISSKGSRFTTQSLSRNRDLFHEGESFSLLDSSSSSKFSKYFANSYHFNNGNEFPYKVEVTSLSAEGASIRITEHK